LLTEDNNILAGDILAWSNRASANKIVRVMAGELKWYYGATWNKIYDELNYRYGINLKIRQGQDHSNKPFIEFLRDDEYEKLYKTIAAMLQARYINPSRIFKKAKVELEST
jgi:translation initiation factor 2 alpha subunit (eIF-2alpha)